MVDIPLPLNNAWKGRTALNHLFSEALNQHVFSAASLLIGTPETVLHEETWGHTQWGGSPVNFQTQFDLASLTKPLWTTVLNMVATSADKIGLDDALLRFFPSAGLSREKRRITLRQLLNHSSGFPPYIAFYRELIALPLHQRSAALQSWILTTPLLSEPGKTARYSDLGFILLGTLLEDIFEASLLELSFQWVQAMALCSESHPLATVRFSGFPHFRPLRTSTDPTSPPESISCDGGRRDRRRDISGSGLLSDETMLACDPIAVAATEYCPWRKRLLRGEVHDENAYTLGGIAGHAGLFGTAREVFHLLSLLWRIYLGRILDGPCSQEAVRTFWTRSDRPSESTWALGYDTPSADQSSAGNFFSTRSVGHLGFTGTSFWLDLEKEILVILLTNRVYPSRQNEKLRAFRPMLHNLIMESFNGKSKR